MRIDRVGEFFEVMGRKWVPPVLAELRNGPKRRNCLLREVDHDLSGKVLDDTLRHLERLGMVHRNVDHQALPPGVAYEITILGSDLARHFEEAYAWMIDHADEITSARHTWDHNHQSGPSETSRWPS